MTIEERLVKSRGLTDDPALADWLLRDGRMTNGSYEGHQRDMDHSEIGEFYKTSRLSQPGSGIVYVRKFMRRGNVRMGVSEFGYCFEFDTVPSVPQLRRLVPDIVNACLYNQETYAGRLLGPVTQMYQRRVMDGPEFLRYLDRYVFHDGFRTLTELDRRVAMVL